MRQECREHFPHHRLQRKLSVSGPDMHHGSCVTHVPWCMSGSLNCGGGENVPGIPGACATRNFTYLTRGPWMNQFFRTWLGFDYFSHYIPCSYLLMLELKLNPVGKRTTLYLQDSKTLGSTSIRQRQNRVPYIAVARLEMLFSTTTNNSNVIVIKTSVKC